LCPNSGCDKMLPKFRFEDHVKACRTKLGRGYVFKRPEGHIRGTWYCSGAGCDRSFRAEKACARHVKQCSHFEIDHIN